MGKVICVKYDFCNEDQLSEVHIMVHSTHCRKCRKTITASKGEAMLRRFGFSPYRNWARLKEKLNISLI